MARAKNPDSPYRNKNAITPTSGGNTTGSAISAPSVFRPGKSNHSNRNASGMPITAARTTLTSEIQTLAHSAAHSPGRVTNARSAVPPPARRLAAHDEDRIHHEPREEQGEQHGRKVHATEALHNVITRVASTYTRSPTCAASGSASTSNRSWSSPSTRKNAAAPM